ncbi:MAG: hypothetical protein IH602_06465 [Bryobacteraceae bacterium]|nr:hypothetical protein [Bryobacteraceae bacterium]
MWKLTLGIILCAAWAQGQPVEEFLLPSARQVKAVVVDEEGAPVVGAEIFYSNDFRNVPSTQLDGKFQMETRAPVLVVRKGGYESRMIRTEEAAVRITMRRGALGEGGSNRAEESPAFRITLRKTQGERRFPACSGSGQHRRNAGLSTSFVFPKVPGVDVSDKGHDVDYTTQYYSIKTKNGRKGVQHGWGPLWGGAEPLYFDVWKSVKYEEIRYENDGLTIVDARGQASDGQRWRSLGKFGETATYSDVDEATAKILDRLLDGACLSVM